MAWSNYNEIMFFRRERTKQITFDDRLSALRGVGFTVEPQGGTVKVTRDGIGALIERAGEGVRVTERPGVLRAGEIAALVDGGFQKFFRTPSGKTKPALASELKAIYNFQEDFKEALGLDSYYNESLGTVSKYYLYDRVQGRDRGGPKRIWEM